MAHTPDSSAGVNGTVRQQYASLPHTAVTIDDAFWAPRLHTNRTGTIGHLYRELRATGSIDAFRPGWHWPEQATRRGAWGGTTTMFWDSDVAKWIETASYSLATHPDPHLDTLLDDVITLIAQTQHADGYLNTWFTYVDPAHRWQNLRDWHELYCAGHLIEAGVAHFNATAKRSLLDIVCRYADHIDDMFGLEPGKRLGYPGHPEIELALVKLHRATGEQRYLALSRYFVDERGRQPHYFEQEARLRGEDPVTFWAKSFEYNQSHRPVREQREVVGHAVRAVYLYTAMAELAGAYDDARLLGACRQLWQHLTTTRMYVTGGIGTSKQNEGFTGDYDLPNESAYAETCAAISMIFWAQRMLQLECDARYADIMELELYNSVLSSVSLDGKSFFYDNPLASDGTHHRQPWFICPCCPPNLARLFASLGQYIYGYNDQDLVVHLYIQCTGRFQLANQMIMLRQETNYPWDGTVTLHVEPEQAAEFGLQLRIPGWCDDAELRVNQTVIDLQANVVQGYVRIEREWQPGDTVMLTLPMPVVALSAHPDVVADVGHVALQRGPLVYCLEQVDHALPLHRLVVTDLAALAAQHEPDLLGGITILTGSAGALDPADWQGMLYRPTPPTTQPCTLHAVPYFAWNNREPGAMQVWIRATQSLLLAR
ncbi:MAG: glycoside hydrolase family 127 protein [Herpetosiphonaceae bacterium]|nr:glycoside hydrolase family 127 protein [Herpetosiphonaceae bacterium]